MVSAACPWLSETVLPVARPASPGALPVVDLTPSREGLMDEVPRAPSAPEKEEEEPEEKEEVEGAEDEEESKEEEEGDEVKEEDPKEVEEEPKEDAWVKEEDEPKEEGGVTDVESVLVLVCVPRDREFWRLIERVENT